MLAPPRRERSLVRQRSATTTHNCADARAPAHLEGGSWRPGAPPLDDRPGQRIVVLGATGRVGSAFAEAALCAGHRVVALVRSQPKANIVLRKAKARFRGALSVRSRPDWLEEGGVAALTQLLLEPDVGGASAAAEGGHPTTPDAAAAVAGTVVVNAVGPATEESNASEVERSTRACVRAMEAAGARKLLVVGGSSQLLECPGTEGLMWWEVGGIPPHQARQLEDALAAYDELDASSLDYVLLCPGVVKTGPRTGKCVHSVEECGEALSATTHADLAELMLREAERDPSLGGLHKRVRVGAHSYGQRGCEPRADTRAPLLENCAAPGGSLRAAPGGSLVCGVTFPRHERDTLGYGRAVLEMPASRWGSLSYGAAVPASRSAVRASRHAGRTPSGLGVVHARPHPLRYGEGNLSKGELLLAARLSSRLQDEGGAGPRKFPDFPYARRKPQDCLAPLEFAQKCGWAPGSAS